MTGDLFRSHRREDAGEEYPENRVSRRQMMDDNAWRPLVVQLVYERGTAGISLEALLSEGVERGWWQDTAAKHFGEKMRVAFSTGLIFIPTYPGVGKLRHVRVVHPEFVDVSFRNRVLQKDFERVKAHMARQDYTKR